LLALLVASLPALLVASLLVVALPALLVPTLLVGLAVVALPALLVARWMWESETIYISVTICIFHIT
jgi:hypothetical protein